VIASIAHIRTDQRVAFSTVRFQETDPVVWKMMTVGSQDTATLKEGEIFGYPVDSGTGCFADLRAAMLMAEKMKNDENFYEVMIAEMDKTYRNTWSWLNMSFGDANVIAFSSGYGDGMYATWAGLDSGGEIAVVTTDFDILPNSGDRQPV